MTLNFDREVSLLLLELLQKALLLQNVEVSVDPLFCTHFLLLLDLVRNIVDEALKLLESIFCEVSGWGSVFSDAL